MNIVVVMRQVPDLVEGVEIMDSELAIDLDEAAFVVNESDDHALEQALILKERVNDTMVTVVVLDHDDVDNMLFTAVAKGADRVIKIEHDEDVVPDPRSAAEIYGNVIRALGPDIVLVGSYAHDELQGVLGPELAVFLDLPFAGVVRGVQLEDTGPTAVVWKEFAGAMTARLSVTLPAVLGIVGAEQPPRYVPVNRIRAAMKSADVEIQPGAAVALDHDITIRRLYAPQSGAHAEMLTGSEHDIATQIARILKDRGVVR